MQKTRLTFFLVIGSIFLSACVKKSQTAQLTSVANSQKQSQAASLQFSDRQHILVDLGQQSALELEVVNTPDSITLGLSGRDKIGADGMLFVFGQPRRPVFWMKEMKFNLDLIWINEGKIVEITPNVPAPAVTTPLYELPTYTPQQAVDMVLEVEAGNAKLWNVQAGDTITF